MARPLKYKAKLISHHVEGLDEVLKRYRAEVQKLSIKSNEGLVEFALHMRRVTERKTPYTPVDKGNLRASYFIAAAQGLVPDPLGFSGNFKTPRKHHITLGEIRAQHNAVKAAALTEVRSSKKPNVAFGYSVNYALAVHEMVGESKEVNWSRLGSNAKWFETHLNSSLGTFIKIMKDNTQIK